MNPAPDKHRKASALLSLLRRRLLRQTRVVTIACESNDVAAGRTAAEIALAAAKFDLRVLFIDVDPIGHATNILLSTAQYQAVEHDLLDVIHGRLPIATVAERVRIRLIGERGVSQSAFVVMHVIRATDRIRTIDVDSDTNYAQRFAAALQAAARRFDIIFLTTPPHPDPLNTLTLGLATRILTLLPDSPHLTLNLRQISKSLPPGSDPMYAAIDATDVDDALRRLEEAAAAPDNESNVVGALPINPMVPTTADFQMAALVTTYRIARALKIFR